MPKIAVERTIGKTKKAVLDGLIAYNTEKMGKQKYKRFAISLRQGNKIVGGIVGEVWTAVLFIQFFWIEQKLRGKDYGTKLIKAIEDEARRFWSDARLRRHDELPGARLLSGVRLQGVRFDRGLS
jgi:RimJ/RimL family protein N-acetyltransferase